jgi:hypothetical protein
MGSNSSKKALVEAENTYNRWLDHSTRAYLHFSSHCDEVSDTDRKEALQWHKYQLNKAFVDMNTELVKMHMPTRTLQPHPDNVAQEKVDTTVAIPQTSLYLVYGEYTVKVDKQDILDKTENIVDVHL